MNRRGSSEKFERRLPAFAKRPGGNLKAFQERGRRGRGGEDQLEAAFSRWVKILKKFPEF